MENNISTDRWLWRMYREVAQYVHNPSAANERELLNLVSQYRQEAEHKSESTQTDEHEWAMNFR